MELRDRWPLRSRERVREALLAAYDDPTRGYHDTLHLTEVLDRVYEIGGAGEGFDRVAVALAAWFHDGVYDGEPDAEERSAQWAERDLVGVPEAGEVARLVRLTLTHRPEPGDTNGAVLSDADLGILAADAGRYREYTSAVRREYTHVPDDLFREGRAAILRDLLAKPTLFHTAYARERWEAAARANVEAELRGAGG